MFYHYTYKTRTQLRFIHKIINIISQFIFQHKQLTLHSNNTYPYLPKNELYSESLEPNYTIL